MHLLPINKHTRCNLFPITYTCNIYHVPPRNTDVTFHIPYACNIYRVRCTNLYGSYTIFQERNGFGIPCTHLHEAFTLSMHVVYKYACNIHILPKCIYPIYEYPCNIHHTRKRMCSIPLCNICVTHTNVFMCATYINMHITYTINYYAYSFCPCLAGSMQNRVVQSCHTIADAIPQCAVQSPEAITILLVVQTIVFFATKTRLRRIEARLALCLVFFLFGSHTGQRTYTPIALCVWASILCKTRAKHQSMFIIRRVRTSPRPTRQLTVQGTLERWLNQLRGTRLLTGRRSGAPWVRSTRK